MSGIITVNNSGVVDGTSGSVVVGVVNDFSNTSGVVSDIHGSGTCGGSGSFKNFSSIILDALPPFPPDGLTLKEALPHAGHNYRSKQCIKRKRVLTNEACGHGVDQVYALMCNEESERKCRRMCTTEESTCILACGDDLKTRKPLNGDHELALAISSPLETRCHKVSSSVTNSWK
jgi:hypothetical protein